MSLSLAAVGVFASFTLSACPNPDLERDRLGQRITYLNALRELVATACPCGVAMLETSGRWLDELSCHPCDGMLVPVTTTLPMGRLQ